MNKCNNVEIIEAAVSDKEGEANFLENGISTSMLSRDGSLKIKTVFLDSLLEKGKILPPDILKIDVEGAEFLVLKGVIGILKKYHPTLLLSTHGEIITTECIKFVKEIGYNLESLSGNSIEESTEFFIYYKDFNNQS